MRCCVPVTTLLSSTYFVTPCLIKHVVTYNTNVSICVSFFQIESDNSKVMMGDLKKSNI